MKRRNAETGKLRRPIKRTKITEGMYGNSMLYLKFVMLWASVVMADYMLEFRFEFLWPYWMMFRAINDSFKYQGVAVSVFFICIALTSDLICFFFIPIQYMIFAGTTYVWVQCLWYTFADKGICLPTVAVWLVVLYVEGAVRAERWAGLELYRSLAAHCVGYPVVTLGVGVKSYVGHRLRLRRQRQVRAENEFYFQLMRDALPESALEQNQPPPPPPQPQTHTQPPHLNGSVRKRCARAENGACPQEHAHLQFKLDKLEKHLAQQTAQRAHAHAHAHSNGAAAGAGAGPGAAPGAGPGAGADDDKHDHAKGGAKSSKSEKKETNTLKEERKKNKNKDKDKETNDSYKSTEQSKEQNIVKEVETTNNVKNNKECNSNNKDKDKEKEKEKERDKEREREKEKERENKEREREKEKEKERDREKEREVRESRGWSEEVRRVKAELGAALRGEAEAKRALAAAAAAERARRAEHAHLKQQHQALQNKVSAWRSSERASLERRLGEERRARSAVEHQLQRARAARTSSGECENEWCKSRRSAAEAEAAALRRDLQRGKERALQLQRDLAHATEQVRSLEGRAEEGGAGAARLAAAWAALQEQAAHLERALSAETRVKLDLLSALGDAKRQMHIQEGLISKKEKEIAELKAQMLAVMPSELVTPGGPQSKLRLTDTSPLDPNATVYTPKQLCLDA